jgi:sodium/proline symporter
LRKTNLRVGMSSQTVVLITLIFYKLVLLGIGFWASKRVVSESDFFIAGKGSSQEGGVQGSGLGPWVAGLSYAASTSSAWVLLGYTGFVFSVGFKALWLIPGIFGGYGITWLVLGPRLNAETAERGHITMVDFLIADVGQKWRGRIAALAAVLIIFCFVFYVAAQFQAAGNAFSATFGLGLVESVILGAVIIVAYCLMGGFWAASITDTLQALVMVGACLLVPFVTIATAGGLGPIMETLHANEAPSYFQMSGGVVGLAAIGGALGLLGTGLGAAGQPQLLNRIMAVKDQKARLLGAAITIGWGTLIYIGVTLLALAARALLPEIPPEQVFFAAAEAYLPPILAGIVLAAILSAVMSTVDSLLLAAASAISHDLGAARFMPSTLKEGRELLAGRLAMIAVAVMSVILTLSMPDSIFERVLFSWVALGAAFGPTALARCFGWRVSGLYVFLAIFSGFAIAVIGSGMDGTAANLSEKWLSWIVGFGVLCIGKMKEAKGASR